MLDIIWEHDGFKEIQNISARMAYYGTVTINSLKNVRTFCMTSFNYIRLFRPCQGTRQRPFRKFANKKAAYVHLR